MKGNVSFGQKIKDKFSALQSMGKNIDPSQPLELQNNVTLKEFIALGLYKVGSQIVSTTEGSKASVFLYECFYKGVMDSTEVASYSAILTTITTILGILVGIAVATVAFKWKSKYGHYRQWFIIGVLPMAILYSLEFVVPDFGKSGLIAFQFAVAIIKIIFSGFYGLSANIIQVISPNVKEKKRVVTMNQLYYYIGYGLAYLLPLILGSLQREYMYLITIIVGSIILIVGSVLCFMWCKERIDLPPKKNERITKTSLKLFKEKNYVIYHIIDWTTAIAMTGKMMTYLAAIVVGTDKAVVLTLPSAIGTGVGVLITGFLSKKFSPVKLLKFAGIYMPVMALLTFFSVFFTHEFGVLFYIFYFLFGLSFGLAELSKGHWDAEFNDFLEWKTGERLEAVQGVVPGWVKTGLNYAKDLLIPFMLAWVGYETNMDGANLMEFMKKQPTYDSTCLWILAFAVFGVSINYLIRTILLTVGYDIDGEKKKKMYEELSVMRKAKMGGVAFATASEGEVGSTISENTEEYSIEEVSFSETEKQEIND